MVGRAGRVGFAECGESYLIPEGNLDEYRAWSGYVLGQPESLRSQLLPDGDPRSLMLRVLASAPVDATGLMSEEEVVGFLDSSYAAYLARRDPGQTQWTIHALRQAFSDLISARLVERDAEGFRLTQLGRFAGESGVHVDSILRLVHVLSHQQTLNSFGLITAAQVTRELDDVYIAVNARGRNTELPRWPRVLVDQGVPAAVIDVLRNTSPDLKTSIQRAKRASAAALWIGGFQTDAIELELTRHLPQCSARSHQTLTLRP
jgi:replicative superfamily II helicase